MIAVLPLSPSNSQTSALYQNSSFYIMNQALIPIYIIFHLVARMSLVAIIKRLFWVQGARAHECMCVSSQKAEQ